MSCRTDTRKGRLSLCMIVKDEEKNLPDCLKTVKECVDEIIVVDTGSTDRTPAVAESFGARVFFFPWQDDFSAARNASLEKACCEYVMWMDADDRIDVPNARRLARLRGSLSGAQEKAFRFLYLFGGSAGGISQYWQPRVFPKRPGVHFQGAVHEQVLPSLRRQNLDVVKYPVEIRHLGWEDAETTRKKLTRNLKILLAAKNAEPIHGYLLAQTYYGLGNFRACLEHLAPAMAACPPGQGNLFAYSMAADCLAKTGRGKEAVAMLRRASSAFPQNGYLHYLLGALLVRVGNPAAALDRLDKAASFGVETDGGPIPGSPEAAVAYCRGQALTRLGRPADAEASFRNAVRLGAGPPAAEALVFLLVRSGRIGAAVSLFESMASEGGRPSRAMNLIMARVYRFIRREQDAKRIYKSLLYQSPADEEARGGLAALTS